MTKPNTAETFRAWSSTQTCGLLDANLERWYESTQNNLFTKVGDSPFLATLGTHLSQASAEYAARCSGANLFGPERDVGTTVRWYRKACASYVEKLFRLNIVENTRFPGPPETGWLTPVSSLAFGCADDVVRTTIVVAYADGPPFLANYLQAAAVAAGHQTKIKDHSKEKGYYAYHLYIDVAVHVANPNGTFEERKIPVEIQITTELQAALREITHHLYESERLQGLHQGWKEDFESARFRAAYMAHSLRFIEAMIVDLRKTMLGRK
ncbi:MAG TPA: hypothetical protein VK629_12585 [Steroidobacteraceae bacterium]|nr:hypothetical protein [Steroidobacteraceae bacterium]